MSRLLRFSVPAVILLLAFNVNANNLVFGHTFSGDESASFLSKVEMIKIESALAQEQLSKNGSLAKAHAEQTTQILTENDTEEISERNSRLATELDDKLTDFVNTFESELPSESEVNDKVTNITDILSEVVSARIDNDQLNNVTVNALVVNDLVGEGLQHYNGAFGIEETSHQENEEHESASNETENGSNETANIVNEADYQSAQAAISHAIDMYNDIKPDDNTNSTELGTSFSLLKEKIDSKSPFDEIDKIVDDKITTLLNDIFKLNLSEEEHHGEEGDEGEDHVDEGADHAEEESHSSSENETHETETER
jgi:hypothetical protein